MTTESNSGAGTDQHVTGQPETGTFLTDEAPATTPANGSSNRGTNTTAANRAEPDSVGGEDAPPIARVAAGMTVLDADGDTAGTVAAVQMPGTDIRPDAPEGLAEELMTVGYMRLDGSSTAMENDTYVSGEKSQP